MKIDHKMNEQHKHLLHILSKLHDKDTAIRASVANDVNELDADGEQTLLSFLQSSDGEQKCDAAFALCLLDADKYIPAIVNLLFDPLGYIRWDIAGLLHDFGDYRAVEPLITVVLNDRDSDVRHNACYALSAIGDSRALPALRYAVENDSGADYEGRLVSEIAAEAIINIKQRSENGEL